MATTPTRPRQVTLAGWMIVVGSAVVVFSAFERVSGLRSIESQESVADFVSEPPGDGLGLSVDQVLDLIQMLSLVAAACATAAAILGLWVLKGSKGARLALAVLALPLLVTGLATGGIVSSLVAAAAVMLWVQPARNWFEGRPPPTPPVQVSVTPPVVPPAASPTDPAAAPQSAVPWPPQLTARPARPAAVVWACVLTWACCAFVAVGLGVTVLVLLVAPDVLFEELHRQNPELADQGLSDGEIEVASYVTAGLFVPWALVAAGFAVQAFRRVAWGRRALLISAGAAGALSLVAMFASTIMVLPFVAAVVTVALLSRPDVRAWYAAPPPGPN
ncbi:MAG TPA: hypothetical protein VNQ53_03630 [Nocardioides sp.]|nr:hypothetical protein [Nocardioides sp.]